MLSPTSSTFAIVTLLLLLRVYAQPPKQEGTDKEFLEPLPPGDKTPSCTRVSTRNLAGQCTSGSQAFWGRARLPQFSYQSGASSVTPSGRSLPSTRLISNVVFRQGGKSIFNKHGLNLLFVFFAQFVDHNLIATPQTATARMDIDVPADDPDLPGVTSLHFVRSVRGKVSKTTLERPLNTLPSPLDLVAVYGPTERRNNALVDYGDIGSATGFLRTSRDNLLPINDGRFVNAPDTSSRFFLAGDHRANEHPVLTAFHTLFLREHNRLAALVKRRARGLPGRDVYEAARAMNIAQFQKIVFEQFYPAAIGRKMPRYRGFRKQVNPTVSDVFSGAAYRVGHTMVADSIPRRARNGRKLASSSMSQMFFERAEKFSSRIMDEMLRGTAHELAQEVDTTIVDTLRNHLFTDVDGEEGFDLVAINLQRGRDHALPKFNKIRQIFGIQPARSFRDITKHRPTAERISRVYKGRVNDVEAFVGLLAEDHAPGSAFGKTMIAVWQHEFVRLRDGDQFLYSLPKKFPEPVRGYFKDWLRLLKQPNGITLADIIARNTDIARSELPSPNVFKIAQPTGIPRTITVLVKSAGKDDGDSADIRINSKSVFGKKGATKPSRGMNVVVINDVNGKVESVRVFDTYASPAADALLQDHLTAIANRKILAIAVLDEASQVLSGKTRSILKNLGSKQIHKLEFRDSWGMVTRIGYPNIKEQLRVRGKGAVQIVLKLSMEPGDSVPGTSPRPSPTVDFKTIDVYILSSGFEDGNDADVQINSKSVLGASGPKRGMNVVVINEITGAVISVQFFDIYSSRAETTKFFNALRKIPNKRILAIAIKDEGSENLDTRTKNLLRKLGSKQIQSLGFRDSWCMITRVGYPEVYFVEVLKKMGSGPAEIQSNRLRLSGSVGAVRSPSPGQTKAPVRFATVFAQSEGFEDGNFAEIKVNSKSVFGVSGSPKQSKRGMNVAVISEKTGRVISVQSFDTYESRTESTKLQSFLKKIPSSRIVAIAIRDEGSENLDQKSKRLLRQLGSKLIEKVGFRDSWCMTAKKGTSFVKENMAVRGKGGAKVNLRLRLE